MSLTIGIDFAANIARLEQNSRAAAGSVKQMAGDINDAVGFAKGALASLGAALTVGAFVSQVKAASEAADAAAKMSDRFGIVSESAVGMSVAIQMAGGSQESLGKALRQTTVAVGEAVTKGGEMGDAFKRLGLSAEELSRVPVNQQFERIIDTLGQVENVTERNYLGNKLLGKSYSEVAGLVAEGSGAIRAATEDAQAWGLAISRVDQAKLEAANDAMTRVQNAAKGVFTTISLSLAPAVKMIADYFADSAKEAGGYKEEVVKGSEFVAKALAYSANLVHGLQQAWAGVKLAVGLVLDFVVQSVATMDRVYTDFINSFADSWVGKKLGMEKREYSTFLTEMSDISRTRVEELKQEAFALVDAGWPAEKILSKYKQVQAQMQAEAERTAAQRQAIGGDGSAITGSAADTKAAEEAAKRELAWQQDLAKRLAALQMAGMAEAEIERGKLTAIQNDLQLARDQGWLTEVTYHQMLEQAQLQHEAKMGSIMAQGELSRRKISQQSWDMQVTSYAGMLKGLTQQAATSNKEMFELNKAAGISETVVNTYRAAQGAYAALAGIPIVGPFLGAAAAAVAIASGLAQVNAIKSAQFGSSTSPPSIAGGAATPVYDVGSSAPAVESTAVPQAVQPRSQINLTLQGTQFSYQQVAEEIIPLINEASGNGADIIVQYA